MTAISWWRSWHGAPTDHKWAVIAARSGAKAGVVSAVAWALLDYASQHKERGTVAGFDTEEYSVFSGFPQKEIEAVIQAMTDKRIVVDGKLANWEKRQPKREDDSAPRVAKLRAKKHNVTQGNATPDNVTESNGGVTLSSLSVSLSESVSVSEGVEEDNAPFDKIKAAIESQGIMPSSEADVNSIIEMVEAGITPKDVLAGIAWKAENNNGKPVRYVGQLFGPAKTAMAKRLQDGNSRPQKEKVYAEVY